MPPQVDGGEVPDMPIHESRSRREVARRPRAGCPLRTGLPTISLLLTSACHTWQQAPTAGATAVGAYEGKVRVTVAGGSVVALCGATLTADSLVARRCGSGSVADSVGRVAVSRRDIVLVEERRFSDRRTVGLVVGSLAVVALAAAATVFISLAAWDWE